MSDDAAWDSGSDDGERALHPQTVSPPLLRATAQSSPAKPARQASYTTSLWNLWSGNKAEDQPNDSSSLPAISKVSSTASSTASSSHGAIPISIKGSAAASSSNTAASSGGSSKSWTLVDPSAPSGKGISRAPTPLTAQEMQAAVKPKAEDVMKDPALALSRLRIADDGRLMTQEKAEDDDIETPSSPVNKTPTASIIRENGVPRPDPPDTSQHGKEGRRKAKFLKCLRDDNVDISQLKSLAWAGIPAELRPLTWQLLLNYVPANAARRVSVLARKRQEYADAVKLAFARGQSGLDQTTWHQIFIDVPRTNPGVRLWQYEATQRSLERILYVWAIRHPASGYVQGINDLVTPFFQVFLTSYINVDPECFDIGLLPPSIIEALEADSFWCLSKLLDGLQDNYIYAQPGIQRQVSRMKELCARVDAPLAAHLEEQNVEFIQFAWRWQNCLLLREVPVKSVVRMWDTYFAEGTDSFAEFHLFVCLAFLVKWSDKLRSMDFQGIIMFLQSLPSTQTWSEEATVLLLSEAFLWRSIWGGADSAHLSRKRSTRVV